jgi:hypothetical protein
MFWGVSKSLNGSYSTETISRPPCVVGNQDMSLIAWYMLPGDGIPGSGIDVDAYSDETNTWDSTHDLAPLSGPSSVIPPDARQAPPDDDVISTVVADLPKTGVTLTADATYTTDPTQAFEHWLVFADHCEIGPDDVVTAAHGSTGAAIAAYHHPKKPPIHPPSKTEPILVIMQGEEGAVIVPRRSGGGPGPISKFATGIAAGHVAYIEGGAAKDARTRAAQQVKGLKEVITFAQEGVNAVEARK